MNGPPNLRGVEGNFPEVLFDFMDIEDEEDLEHHCPECPFDVEEEPERSPGSSGLNQDDHESNKSATSLPTEGRKTSAKLETEKQDNSNEESEDSDSSMLDIGVHPLLFPDVIRDVLNFLPATDVESCRLVCRAWNVEACTVLRSKRIVVFVEPDAVRVYNNAMRNTVDFPHAQYEFCIQDFTGLVDDNLREFWRLYGSHIKSLEFRQSHVFWRDFLDVIEQNVPNLEKLSFRHLPRNVLRTRNTTTERRQISSVKELRLASLPGSNFSAVERLTDLLRTLPNLEVIEFLPVKGPLKSKVSTVLVDVLSKPEVSLRNLKRIGLSLDLNPTGLDALASKRFPFQSLQLTLSNNVKANAFKELMNSLQSTLTDLRISFPETFSNSQTFSAKNAIKPEECVQALRNLKTLKMTNFKGSINFVQKMQNLETLDLTTPRMAHTIPFGFQQLNRGFSFSRGCPPDDHQLKNLRILPTSPAIAIAETMTLESISRCFPALNSIHLQGVDDDGLGIIYRNLPFLSEVELSKAKCTDQGLTGISLEICNDMRETSTYLVVQAEKYRRDLFIGSLQYLRRLTIDADRISDAAIALGVADCKNLKELKIGSPLITDTGVIFITDKFWKQLDYLDVSECSEITEQSKFYAGEKLIGKLNVADSTPEDLQTQSKPAPKVKLLNLNRGIVKPKKHACAAPSSCSSSSSCSTPPTSTFLSTAASSHSKYFVEDLEFFEEHSEDELRDRGLGAFPGQQFNGDRNRQRVVRIREAFRRNADFMRNLQRMGVAQFRRLYRREVREEWEIRDRLLQQDIEAEEDEHQAEEREAERNAMRNVLDMEELDLMVFRHRDINRAIRDDFFPPNENNLGLLPEVDVGGAGDGHPINNGNGLNNPIIPPRIIEDDDDDGPIVHAIIPPAEDAGEVDAERPNRLPEIHLAEIFRLGLRPDDIEFWFHNRPLFDREENANAANLPAVIRAVHADIHDLAGVVDDRGDRLGVGDEDIDLEAIRQVVMNAFGNDLPDLEG